MKKILFLDIDGVLNSRRSALALNGFPCPGKEERFDSVAVELVRRICNKGVDIVLSSCWRQDRNYKNILGLPIIDKTPNLDLPISRGEEIAQWIAEHGEPDRWAIVDDDPDMLTEQKSHFVHVDNSDGLLLKDYTLLCKILEVSI